MCACEHALDQEENGLTEREREMERESVRSEKVWKVEISVSVAMCVWIQRLGIEEVGL